VYVCGTLSRSVVLRYIANTIKIVMVEAVFVNLLIVLGVMVRVMVFTIYNISVISWRSVLLVEESGVPGENYQPVTSH
jgi:hypothetical protein